jgi:hypothetical protein
LEQSNQKLLADVTEFLISSTNDLPSEFLKNGCKLLEKKLSPEAEVEYAKSEKDCVFN